MDSSEETLGLPSTMVEMIEGTPVKGKTRGVVDVHKLTVEDVESMDDKTYATITNKYIELNLSGINAQLFPRLCKLYNKKQRMQYQIRELQISMLPPKRGDRQTTMFFNAMMKQGGITVLHKEEAVHFFDKEEIANVITNMICVVMRYGLKHCYLRGKKVEEEDFI